MTHKRLWLTFSNLAYPVAGIWNGEPVFMAMMLILGAASAYYHAGGTHGNHVDVAAVYATLFFLIAVLWGVPLILIPVPAFAAGLLLRMRTLDIPMEAKVAALVAPLLVFGFLSGAPLLTATVTLVVALATRQWVDHGVWHVLSAGGLALVAHALL